MLPTATRRSRTTSSQAVVERFLAENADVAAGVKQQLQADAARLRVSPMQNLGKVDHGQAEPRSFRRNMGHWGFGLRSR